MTDRTPTNDRRGRPRRVPDMERTPHESSRQRSMEDRCRGSRSGMQRDHGTAHREFSGGSRELAPSRSKRLARAARPSSRTRTAIATCRRLVRRPGRSCASDGGASCSSSPVRKASSSCSRPAMAVSTPSIPRVGIRNVRGLARSTTYARTGFVRPLTPSGSSGLTSNTPRTCRYVSCAIITPFAGARCSSRDATFTVSPIAVNSRVVATSPSTTAPVQMPTRITSDRLVDALKSATARCNASPARTACSGSFSLDNSAPHTAITASPMCLSIRPPNDVTM